MGLLGRTYTERKQNAGNICLLVFLAFLCTAVFMPFGAHPAFAEPGDSTKPLNVELNRVTYEGDTARIQMLLTPATDEEYSSILLDFKHVFGEKTVIKVVYGYVAEFDKYGYYVDFVYTLQEGQRFMKPDSWVIIRDEDGNLLQSEDIYLKVRPPAKAGE